MRILVTGAGGLLGKLVVELASPRHEVLGLPRSELDVTDGAAVARALREFSPRAVLHCAAYTDVDGAERYPERALAVNGEGAGHVAEAARAAKALLIHVSTDYVFDGEAEIPYREGDPPRPLSSYGRSKLEGERRVAQIHPQGSCIVRTGWLYGPGKGFVDWARRKLESADDLPLVEDQRGSPTSARELAGAMLTLTEGGQVGCFHYVNQGETSWIELGQAIAAELSLDPSRIRPIRRSSLNRPAPRPRYTVLSVEKYEERTGTKVPTWQQALKRHLERPR